MKILFIQPYVSFAGVLSDTLPGQLAKRGHHVDVITFFRKKPKSEVFTDGELCFHSIKALSLSIPFFVKEFPYFLSLKQKIIEINPDLIHINNLVFFPTVQTVRLAKEIGKKTIVHVHGVIGERGFLFNFLQWLFVFTLGNKVFKKTDAVICLTEGDTKLIARSGCSLDKINIIANGVDVTKFHPSLNEESNSILWCGRFVQQKGLTYLIEAMKIIVNEKQMTDIKLILTGVGPLLPVVCDLVKKYKLEKNVCFKGLLPRDDLPQLISSTTLFVLPSLTEGMPYVLLEAMASGKTVIGSDISGINDVIEPGKTGILVPPRDPSVLANEILHLLSDEELRKKIGSNARKLMVNKYSWDVIIRKMEYFYDEVCQI